MTRLKWLSLLMTIAILAIVGFQAWWLRENYIKEKKNLEFRTGVSFRETIFNLQAVKLKLDKFINDSNGFVRLKIQDKMIATGTGKKVPPDVETITVVNEEPGHKVKDTLRRVTRPASGVVISMDKTNVMFRKDSNRRFHFTQRGLPGDKIIQLLYDADSLQDPIPVTEVESAYRIALQKEKMNVPFVVTADTITGKEAAWEQPEEINQVTIGLVRPVTYRLQLGNTFLYIMKRMGSPLLFSFFLVGVTLLSFVLLYRNLVRQQRLADIKNEFISNITHELKTPIATVGVAIEALRNFNAINDPQRTKEYLDISQNELHRLSLLVDKVLKLSMFEKKEIDLKPEPVDMKLLVEEVVTSMKLQIEKQNAVISVQTSGDTRLQGDKLHLLSVVFNLLDNALKYGNGNTSVIFDISGNEKELTLSVTDNGIGISPEYKDKVFEKFFRVPAGDTHNTKGYGLGLSYVAHVIQKHNGKISVESQPGSGTQFIITLPKQSI